MTPHDRLVELVQMVSAAGVVMQRTWSACTLTLEPVDPTADEQHAFATGTCGAGVTANSRWRVYQFEVGFVVALLTVPDDAPVDSRVVRSNARAVSRLTGASEYGVARWIITGSAR